MSSLRHGLKPVNRSNKAPFSSKSKQDAADTKVTEEVKVNPEGEFQITLYFSVSRHPKLLEKVTCFGKY